MNNPLTRLEINRVKGANNLFHRFMGSRQYKGGIRNVSAVRLFLLWLDNGQRLPKAVDLPMPKGDESRHLQNKRRYDLAGLADPEQFIRGKMLPADTYTHGYTPEELQAKAEAKKIAAAEAEENRLAIEAKNKAKAKVDAEKLAAKQASNERLAAKWAAKNKVAM